MKNIKLTVGNSFSKLEGRYSFHDIEDIFTRTQKFYIRKKGVRYGEWKTRDIVLFDLKEGFFPSGFVFPTIRFYGDDLEIIDARKSNITVDIPDTKLDLRWYQEEALAESLNYTRGVIHHPTGCVDRDTEFLTPTGWKKISEYNEGDFVAQYTEDEDCEFVRPSEYIKLPCDNLYHFETKYGLDQCLSEEHDIVYKTSYAKNIKKIPFKQMMKQHKDNKIGFHGYFVTTFSSPSRIGVDFSDNKLKLMVAVIADGHFPNSSNRCIMRLKKERKKERIRNLLVFCGIPYEERTPWYDERKGFSQFIFESPRRTKEFDEYWWKNSDSHQLNIISDECLLWDGNQKNEFTSTSKKSADFIQYAFTVSGYRASMYKDKREYKYKNGECYSVRRTKRTLPTIIHSNKKKVKFNNYKTKDGYKYCFTVPSGMLILRRNNKIFITGNSGKSILAAKIIESLDSYTLYIVPSIELLEDIYRKYSKFFGKKYIGTIGEGVFKPSIITVATIQSLWSKIKTPEVINFMSKIDLLIADESHHVKEANYFYGTTTWYKIATMCESYFKFGFTATPGKEGTLQRFFLQGAIGDVIHHVSSKPLIEAGYLTQPVVRFIINPIKCEWLPYEWQKAQKIGIHNNQQRNDMIRDISLYHESRGETVLIIVDKVEKHGKVLHDNISGSIFLHGTTNKGERKDIRAEFREDNIPILISTVMNEGVDFDNIDVAILATGGKSDKQFYQRIGRSMRVKEDKKESLIYDFFDEDDSVLEKHSRMRISYADEEEGYQYKIVEFEDFKK
jgi:superfamily II DNA or RNA helicase